MPFLIVPYSPFQKNETLESWNNRLLSYWGRLLNWKGPGTSPQSSKLFKRLLKIIALAYIYQLTKFGGLMWVVVQKIYSKLYLVSCNNTHRDITDSVNNGMVINTKTWISWGQNIFFYEIKKLLICASDDIFWEVIIL